MIRAAEGSTHRESVRLAPLVCERGKSERTSRCCAVRLFLAALAIAFSTLPAKAQDVDLLRNIQRTNAKIIAQAEPAVVAIARVRKQGLQPAGQASGIPVFAEPVSPADPDFVPNDFGAGIIIRTENPEHPKLILTNYHVVRGGPVHGAAPADTRIELWVTIANKPRFKTAIIAADPHSDLAVLTISDRRLGENPTALAPVTYKPRKGHFVFALGNPYAIARDGSASANWGTVSNVLRMPAGTQPDYDNEFSLFENVHNFGTLMQVSMSLPLGSSGGALLNLDGNLIGITTSLTPLKGYEQSAGYAVPFTKGFRRILTDLTSGYEVEYGFLGVRPANAGLDDFEGLPNDKRPSGGAVALSVTTNSPAFTGGLQPNDVVTKVDDIPIRNNMDLMREVALLGPNAKAKFRVWRPRDSAFVTKTVALGKWPVRDESGIIATAQRTPDWRGIRVDYSTARARYLRGGGTVQFEDAVLIVSVDEKRHGLKVQPGDFIHQVGGTNVGTPEEFHKAVALLAGQTVQLHTTDDRTLKIEP